MKQCVTRSRIGNYFPGSPCLINGYIDVAWEPFPTKTTYWLNVGLMVDVRVKRWPRVFVLWIKRIFRIVAWRELHFRNDTLRSRESS